MNSAQRFILVTACIAILAVNLPFALPRVYMGGYHAVGPDTVHVRLPSTNLNIPSVVISETGQPVLVYLRNGYRDTETQLAPRLTLLLLFAFGSVYAIVTRLRKASEASKPNEPNA